MPLEALSGRRVSFLTGFELKVECTAGCKRSLEACLLNTVFTLTGQKSSLHGSIEKIKQGRKR